ncbi:MAG: ABC transporter substrate-binding protein [Candidatus Humimicrobiaceae bacterium]
MFINLIFFISSFIFTASCKNINSPFDLNTVQNNSSSSSIKDSVNNVEDEEMFFKFKNSQKEKNALNNLNIRKAIFYAIDRERIVKELFGENNKVLNSLFSSTSFFNKSSWDKYTYNPKKAKEFLNLAGFSPENQLFLTIGATDNSPSRAKIENIIKENFYDVGIQLWIDNRPSDEWYGNIVKKGNFELGIWSLYSFGTDDLINYLSSLKIPVNETTENINCNNFYWYKNEKIDLLLDKIAQTENIEELKTYTDEIQDTVSEDAIILPLFSRLYAVAHKKEIKNIQLSTIDGNFFKNIENWTSDNVKVDSSHVVIAGISSEPNTLNPFFEENTSMNYINSLILNGLWALDENSVYKPVLVDESTDQLSENEFSNIKKIKLRDNIFWENGDPITADDIKATIDSIIADKSILKFRDDYEKIEKIEIINNKEFAVYFKENVKDWKKLFLYVFPKKDLDQNKLSNLYESYIFGSGPYKFMEWKKGEYLSLALNKNYYGKIPFFNEIKIIFNDDENLLIESLKKGDIDILSVPVDLKLFEEIKSNKNLNLILKEGNLWEHLAICLKTKE